MPYFFPLSPPPLPQASSRTICPGATPTVTAATEFDGSGQYHSTQALTDDACDGLVPPTAGTYNFWLSPQAAASYPNAYLEIDLGCVRTVSAIKVRNTRTPFLDR